MSGKLNGRKYSFCRRYTSVCKTYLAFYSSGNNRQLAWGRLSEHTGAIRKPAKRLLGRHVKLVLIGWTAHCLVCLGSALWSPTFCIVLFSSFVLLFQYMNRFISSAPTKTRVGVGGAHSVKHYRSMRVFR